MSCAPVYPWPGSQDALAGKSVGAGTAPRRLGWLLHNAVLLRVRADPTSGKKRTLRVPGTEFIDRFLQHVLPAGFKRIRHYGLLSPARKEAALAAARAALAVPPPAPAVVESVAEFMQRVTCIEQARCPHCGIGQFRVVATLRPQRDPPKLRGPP
jgi:hypothetical protein